MNLPTFGGGASDSTMHPVVLIAMILATMLILTLPRKYVIAPVLLSIFLIPLGQQLYVGGVHWLAPRIIILCGLIRVIMINATSKRLLSGGFGSIDRLFFGCVFCEVVGFVLQYNFQSEAVTQQLGILIDFLGGYFLLRALIEDETDIYRALKWMAFVACVLAVGMVWEQVTLQNVFGLLGGTRVTPEIREGKIRSQGAFQHSILAGTFGATLLPLFFLLWKNGCAKLSAAAGIVGCTVMTICSNSSTPLLTYTAGVFGVCLWPIRKNMRNTRRALSVTLIALHLAMSAPVWFLMARIDLTGGSSGYHRAELVDQFVKHFSDWWLIGTRDSGSWGWDMWDQQNQYVNIGETGGLAALVLFIAVISGQFARIGNARRTAEGTKREWLFWFLGAALFANVVAFFGANYFDQSKVAWFILLAMISAATSSMSAPAAMPVATPGDPESKLKCGGLPLPSHAAIT